MGLLSDRVSCIMACVTSSKYSVKFNGKLLESFNPSRGLRQGDPLSPFLFLFVADALSALVKKAMLEERLDLVRICRSSPTDECILHLVFLSVFAS